MRRRGNPDVDARRRRQIDFVKQLFANICDVQSGEEEALDVDDLARYGNLLFDFSGNILKIGLGWSQEARGELASAAVPLLASELPQLRVLDLSGHRISGDVSAWFAPGGLPETMSALLLESPVRQTDAEQKGAAQKQEWKEDGAQRRCFCGRIDSFAHLPRGLRRLAIGGHDFSSSAGGLRFADLPQQIEYVGLTPGNDALSIALPDAAEPQIAFLRRLLAGCTTTATTPEDGGSHRTVDPAQLVKAHKIRFNARGEITHVELPEHLRGSFAAEELPLLGAALPCLETFHAPNHCLSRSTDISCWFNDEATALPSSLRSLQLSCAEGMTGDDVGLSGIVETFKFLPRRLHTLVLSGNQLGALADAGVLLSELPAGADSRRIRLSPGNAALLERLVGDIAGASEELLSRDLCWQHDLATVRLSNASNAPVVDAATFCVLSWAFRRGSLDPDRVRELMRPQDELSPSLLVFLSCARAACLMQQQEGELRTGVLHQRQREAATLFERFRAQIALTKK